jgi:hypothetical protein
MALHVITRPLTAPLATELPDHTRTVAALVRTIVGLNYSRLSHDVGPAGEREAREAFSSMIADQVGITYDPLTYDYPVHSLADASGAEFVHP